MNDQPISGMKNNLVHAHRSIHIEPCSGKCLSQDTQRSEDIQKMEEIFHLQKLQTQELIDLEKDRNRVLELKIKMMEEDHKRLESEQARKECETKRIEDMMTKALTRVTELESAMEKKTEEAKKLAEKVTAVEKTAEKKPPAPTPAKTDGHADMEDPADDSETNDDDDGYLTTPSGETAPLGQLFLITNIGVTYQHGSHINL